MSTAAAEFIIETARPPETCGRPKTALRLALEQLAPGQVLRWRPTCTVGNSFGAVHSILKGIREQNPGRSFKVRKEDQGFDIFRVA
jgi:hypothetical protein